MNFLVRFVMLLFFTSGIISCNQQGSTDTTKHYSEEMLQRFEKIADEQTSRDTSIYLIDSLYRTFPSITPADKYRYYDFKRNLYELIRYGIYSYDTAITYIDSMIAVIEDNGLEKKWPSSMQ